MRPRPNIQYKSLIRPLLGRAEAVRYRREGRMTEWLPVSRQQRERAENIARRREGSSAMSQLWAKLFRWRVSPPASTASVVSASLFA